MQLTGDFLEINASQEPKSISIVVIVVASDLQDEEFSVELTALLHQLWYTERWPERKMVQWFGTHLTRCSKNMDNIRAVYTRENKPRITQSTACVSRELLI